jgi:hypothetical protein
MTVKLYIWQGATHWLGECPAFGIGTIDSSRERVEQHLRREVKALTEDEDLGAERIDIIDGMPPREGA